MLHLLDHRLVRAVGVRLMIDGFARAVAVEPFELQTMRRAVIGEIELDDGDRFDARFDLGIAVPLL